MSRKHSTPDWIPDEPRQPPDGFILPLTCWEMVNLALFRRLRVREQQAVAALMRALAGDAS